MTEVELLRAIEWIENSEDKMPSDVKEIIYTVLNVQMVRERSMSVAWEDFDKSIKEAKESIGKFFEKKYIRISGMRESIKFLLTIILGSLALCILYFIWLYLAYRFG